MGTLALRQSDGFTRPLPAAIVVIAYALAFWLLALVIRHFSIGFTYAVWAGAGTALIAVAGMLAFGEAVNAIKLASIALVIVGVVGLNLSGAAS